MPIAARAAVTILLVAFALSFAALVFSQENEEIEEGEWISQLVGLPAPRLVLAKDPVQGEPLGQESFGGHIVALVFFEIGDDASMATALPEFARVSLEYSKFEEVVFIGVATCADYEEHPERIQPDTIKSTLKENDFHVPVVLDLREKSLARFPLVGRHGSSNAVPITAVIDHEGIVRYHYWLTDDIYAEGLEEAVFSAYRDFDLPGYRGVGSKLSKAADAVKKKEYGKAYKAALKAAKSDDMDEAADGLYLFRTIEGGLRRKIAAAKELRKRRMLIRAAGFLDDTVKKFKDVDGEKDAKSLLKEITRSKEFKTHKKAYADFQRLEATRRENPAPGSRNARILRAGYLKFAEKYSLTPYAKLAKKRAKRFLAK